MELLHDQMLRDCNNNFVGSERNNNNLLDENVSAILKRRLEVMVIGIVERAIQPIIEPLIRRAVKEEIGVALDKVLPSMKPNSRNQASTSLSRSLQLQFLNEISLPVWTGRKIEGKENNLIQVALVDTLTGHIVKSGPEAEVTVEIVVLEGDCGDEEFSNKIVREWKGKKSILRGNNYVKLKEGISLVGEISFTHNSDWMKNHKFRLGARVVDAVSGTSIKEAKTEAFIVKDRRSSLNGKNYPPLPSDEVWRLENIHKHGPYHDRLRTAKIDNVKDFLTLLTINPKRLQKILCVRAAAKVWKVMVDHARTCIVDKGLYLYHDPSYEQKTGVVFNTAGELMGLTIKSHYVPVDDLSEGKKADGQKSVISACEHWEEVISLNDDEASLMHTHRRSVTAANLFHSPCQENLSGSNCRTRPLNNNHAQPSGPSQESLSDSNYRTPPLSTDLAQPSSSCQVIGEGTNNLDISEISEACESPDWVSRYFDEELLRSVLYDHNLQSEMHYEQQGSAGGMLLVTSHAVSIDRTQKIWPQVAKLLRRDSIRRRIGAVELEEENIRKRQRCR